MSSALKIRTATLEDRSPLAAVVNAAFAIETFFDGTRTDEQDLERLMHGGVFLIGENEAGEPAAAVNVEIRGSRGYLGMLAVHPFHQGKGWGRIMVEAAESYFRERNCTTVDMHILSLRPELPPFYRKLGYQETGIEEFRPSRPIKGGVECHCIVMSKSL
jgi:ribosomal protein S18 acetylase RimI-like enzyme